MLPLTLQFVIAIEQERSRGFALAADARRRIRGRVGASMPGPAKAPDAGEGRASEPVAEARTGRRLPTTLHYGGNRMREARDRIHVRAAGTREDCPFPGDQTMSRKTSSLGIWR